MPSRKKSRKKDRKEKASLAPRSGKATNLRIVIRKHDLFLGIGIVIGIVLLLLLQRGFYQTNRQQVHYQHDNSEVFDQDLIGSQALGRREVVMKLYAGTARAKVPLGNPAGFKPGEVVNYSVPQNIVPGNIVLAGAWLNDPSAMIHSGNAQGFAFVGFSGSSVHMVSAPGQSPADVLVFYDGNYAPQHLLGRDVSVKDGRPRITVDKEGTYELLQHVPEGVHLVGIATKAEGFSIKEFSYVQVTEENKPPLG